MVPGCKLLLTANENQGFFFFFFFFFQYCGFEKKFNLHPKKFKIFLSPQYEYFPPKKQKNKKKSPQSDENLKFFTFLGNNYSCSAAIITPPITLQLLKIAHSHAGWLAGWL